MRLLKRLRECVVHSEQLEAHPLAVSFSWERLKVHFKHFDGLAVFLGPKGELIKRFRRSTRDLEIAELREIP